MKRRMDRHRKKSFLSFKDKWRILMVTTLILISAIGYITLFFGGVFVVDQDKLTLDTTTTIVTEEGDTVGKVYRENRNPIKLDDIPDSVVKAYIAIEDKRFYEHVGIDYKSIFRAVYRDIIARQKVEGGSTITQQLAKNLFFSNDKTWIRKTKEVMAAIYLERHYSKDDILEMYLNTIYYGSGVYGIETASQKFFSKPASELTLAEGALFAGIAKAPNGYSPVHYPDKALDRRNTVLRVMEQADVISKDEFTKAQAMPLDLNMSEEEERPWVNSYLDLVMQEASEKYNLSVDDLRCGGYRVVVNMDNKAQKLVYDKFKDNHDFPGNTDEVEGAFVMKEAKSGKIKVAIGGRDYRMGDLNRVNVNRQPGSTFKPIAVYGPALMTDEYVPYSLLPDRQVDSDMYDVDNFNHEHDDIVSLYQALIDSKNIAPTWLLDQIGIDYAKEYLEDMGMNLPDDDLAIALGGLEDGVSPVNMADAFSTFANGGTMVESSTISEIYDRNGKLLYESEPETKDIFTADVAWNMTEMLAYAVKQGTARAGEYHYPLAGKTGTTEHPLVEGENKDAWFVGYTPNMVTALWMGNDVSDKEHYLTGGSAYPTRLTKEILTELNDVVALGEKFNQPEHVDSLPEPIKLPDIKDVRGSVSIGGETFIQGKLEWSGSDDERVAYRIYKERRGINERVGEVEGKTEFTVTGLSLFKSSRYYIVPYDPIANIEGKRSETVELSF